MKEFEIGDKVVMKGAVESIDTSQNYILGVRWANEQRKSFYLYNGRGSCTDTEPKIFHDTTQERVVQVRDNEYDRWYTRVLLMQKNGKYICWEDAETIEEAKKEMYTTRWNFMRELPEKKVLTMQEIAEKFGIDVEQIEIEK